VDTLPTIRTPYIGHTILITREMMVVNIKVIIRAILSVVSVSFSILLPSKCK